MHKSSTIYLYVIMEDPVPLLQCT